MKKCQIFARQALEQQTLAFIRVDSINKRHQQSTFGLFRVNSRDNKSVYNGIDAQRITHAHPRTHTLRIAFELADERSGCYVGDARAHLVLGARKCPITRALHPVESGLTAWTFHAQRAPRVVARRSNSLLFGCFSVDLVAHTRSARHLLFICPSTARQIVRYTARDRSVPCATKRLRPNWIDTRTYILIWDWIYYIFVYFVFLSYVE